MKNFLLIIVFVFFAGVCSAQTIFEENFNYTTGSLLNANGWIPSGSPPSTVNQLLVTSPGLTFTGYPPASGNATTLAATGEDVYRTFTTQTSGSVYMSFLMNVQTAQATGDYIMALSPSASQTNYYARTHLKSSGNGYLIGLSKSNELGGGYIYGTTNLTFNTTYLVVVKHQFLGSAPADTLDDVERVFVFTGTPPSTEPTTSEIGPYVQTGKSDPKDLGYITIRQGSTTAAPTLKLDGIRVMKSWAALLTDVKNEFSIIPSSFELSQNYPNPFNPSTVIKYQVPQNSHVNLSVYDILGNKIATLENQEKAAGSYEVKFDAANIPSGVYFYTIQTGSFSQTKKMILMK
ncbi:MAG: hypothetical protein CVV24_06060 [Ignavibacteriae bacterium HGW-Ignavibacteriae-3]|nr:MAG: hypothetical protein CVV24_06060 [Ignavibacteriae bacterium HGW-Ignavibacteriae-3]